MRYLITGKQFSYQLLLGININYLNIDIFDDKFYQKQNVTTKIRFKISYGIHFAWTFLTQSNAVIFNLNYNPMWHLCILHLCAFFFKFYFSRLPLFFKTSHKSVSSDIYLVIHQVLNLVSKDFSYAFWFCTVEKW